MEEAVLQAEICYLTTAKGPKLVAQGDVLGQTLQLAELCASREHGNEKQ